MRHPHALARKVPLGAHEAVTSGPIAFRDLADPSDQLELFTTDTDTGEAS